MLLACISYKYYWNDHGSKIVIWSKLFGGGDTGYTHPQTHLPSIALMFKFIGRNISFGEGWGGGLGGGGGGGETYPCFPNPD